MKINFLFNFQILLDKYMVKAIKKKINLQKSLQKKIKWKVHNLEEDLKEKEDLDDNLMIVMKKTLNQMISLIIIKINKTNYYNV